MKRVLWLVLLAAGCGGSKSSIADLGAADASAIADLAPAIDLFAGSYSCQEPLDEYCAQPGHSCIRQLADADKPDAGCGPNVGIVAATCGSYVYITDYTLTPYYPSGSPPDGAAVFVFSIAVYDSASGQLVAILADGTAGNSDCLAGPSNFADPDISTCPGVSTESNDASDGGVLQICPYYYQAGSCGVHGGRVC
jgi:hypothetical protein